MPRPLSSLPYATGSGFRLERGVQLHAMVAAVGHSRHAGPDYVWNGRDRGSTPFAVIQSTIDGAGTYSTPSADHTVGAGQAMVALIPGDHEYRVSPDAASHSSATPWSATERITIFTRL
jgi:hypothetical protein